MSLYLLSPLLVTFVANVEASYDSTLLSNMEDQFHKTLLEVTGGSSNNNENRRLNTAADYQAFTNNYCQEVLAGSIAPLGGSCGCDVYGPRYAAMECRYPSEECINNGGNGDNCFQRSALGTLLISGSNAAIQLDICHQYQDGIIGVNCMQQVVNIPLDQGQQPDIEYSCTATVDRVPCSSCVVCPSKNSDVAVDCSNLNKDMSTPVNVDTSTGYRLETQTCQSIDEYLTSAGSHANAMPLSVAHTMEIDHDLLAAMSGAATNVSSFISSSLWLLSVAGLAAALAF